MGKLLFWIAIVLIALLAARMLARQAARREAKRKQPVARPEADRATPASDTMVRCAHCGIHLPRAEALMQNGQTWCGAEHARLGVRKPS